MWRSQTDGSSLYHVVDGKQRLLSVLEFLEDKFPVSKSSYSLLRVMQASTSANLTRTQKGFYSYFLPVEFFTAITHEEVTEIFDRFNRNVQRLNDQELRHARYGGQFIKLMETLADEPLWQELGTFSQADVRRMKDVEYVSVLFILTMHGIQEGDALDDFYAEYDEEIPMAAGTWRSIVL